MSAVMRMGASSLLQNMNMRWFHKFVSLNCESTNTGQKPFKILDENFWDGRRMHRLEGALLRGLRSSRHIHHPSPFKPKAMVLQTNVAVFVCFRNLASNNAFRPTVRVHCSKPDCYDQLWQRRHLVSTNVSRPVLLPVVCEVIEVHCC